MKTVDCIVLRIQKVRERGVLCLLSVLTTALVCTQLCGMDPEKQTLLQNAPGQSPETAPPPYAPTEASAPLAAAGWAPTPAPRTTPAHSQELLVPAGLVQSLLASQVSSAQAGVPAPQPITINFSPVLNNNAQLTGGDVSASGGSASAEISCPKVTDMPAHISESLDKLDDEGQAIYGEFTGSEASFSEDHSDKDEVVSISSENGLEPMIPNLTLSQINEANQRGHFLSLELRAFLQGQSNLEKDWSSFDASLAQKDHRNAARLLYRYIAYHRKEIGVPNSPAERGSPFFSCQEDRQALRQAAKKLPFFSGERLRFQKLAKERCNAKLFARKSRYQAVLRGDIQHREDGKVLLLKDIVDEQSHRENPLTRPIHVYYKQSDITPETPVTAVLERSIEPLEGARVAFAKSILLILSGKATLTEIEQWGSTLNAALSVVLAEASCGDCCPYAANSTLKEFKTALKDKEAKKLKQIQKEKFRGLLPNPVLDAVVSFKDAVRKRLGLRDLNIPYQA